MKSFNFSMSAHYPAFFFRVAVYPTLDHLRKAARRYEGGGEWKTVEACYHPPCSVMRSNYGGMIRFAETNMDTAVLVHEAFHAAAGAYRKEIKPRINLKDHCGREEESLAYILDDIYSNLMTKLKEEGYEL